MIESTLYKISKYLTLDVVDKAFKKRTNSEDTVNSLKVSRAAPAGEGLLSAVYRIQVFGYEHTANFIVKGLVSDEVLRKSLDCAKYFDREAEFFKNILPVLVEFQKSCSATERIEKHLPKCYSCHIDGINDYILIEDLAETGCLAVPKHLTDDIKRKILEVLAHFHSVSMGLRIKKPELFNKTVDKIPEIYYGSNKRNFYTPYLQRGLDINKTVLTEYLDSDNIYFRKFNEAISNDAFGQISASVTKKGYHPVVCHGDCWCPNFLISEERTTMIDFQLVRCCSPVTDLVYIILLNGCSDKDEFYNAVDIYYSALGYYLDHMGLSLTKVFSRDTLLQELKEFGIYGFFASMTSFPLLSSERCDVLKSIKDRFPGMDTVPLECIWELTPIKNPRDKLRLVNLVRVAVDVGLI